jgi:atypical dual specificity phosphatase
MMQGFYWLVDGVLAGCPRPGSGRGGGYGRGRGGDDEALIDADLAWLREQGIGAILSMTEEPLPGGSLERHDLEGLHLPVDDLRPPAPRQLQAALAFIDWQRVNGRAVAVHCLMGQGRTGTVLAAYLIRDGRTPDDALRELRSVCPGAVGSPEQERALEAFATRRDWIV